MKNKIRWISPSNIAIIKYWGKLNNQIPLNPSLSFTLSESKTETSIEWDVSNTNKLFSFEFTYDGKTKPEFESKIDKLFQRLLPECSWLNSVHLKIDSKNTFPHSTGIASSASSMSALALCLVSIENEINKHKQSIEEFRLKASHFARLGSGSASRSVFPVAALWGKTEDIENSSNEYAISFDKNIHPLFSDLQDYIFIINRNEKPISSTAGHQLMNNHPYVSGRIKQANQNLHILINALSEGDWSSFAKVCEEEALSLHGLMMSSRPGYLLLEPESLLLIAELKGFQKESNLPITFTIDAGPNIHVLFPKNIKIEIDSWIRNTLPKYLSDNRIIFDSIGNGPQQITK